MRTWRVFAEPVTYNVAKCLYINIIIYLVTKSMYELKLNLYIYVHTVRRVIRNTNFTWSVLQAPQINTLVADRTQVYRTS